MSIQNPGILAWLIPLAGIILLLYLLKMKRRDLRVPATFLWPERVEEIRANALFRNRSVLIERGFPLHAAAVFEDHVAADAVQKSPEFVGVADLLALLRADEPGQALLHKIVHVGAVVPDVVQNLVAKFKPKAFEVWFAKIHFGFGAG